MSIVVDFDLLELGSTYDRPTLAALWGYKAHQALSRGVVTPVNSNKIILFVTKEKQSSLPQYSDYIIDEFLYWEAEEKGRSTQRIINAASVNDEIHLFYRNKHHQYFKYLGLVDFIQALDSKRSSEFLFEIIGKREVLSSAVPEPIFSTNIKPTQATSLRLSRKGQGKYRTNLVDLWDGCSVTGINTQELLQASHIKPWKDSDDAERLDPYNGLLLSPLYDKLFDKGFITFNDDGSMVISKSINKVIGLLKLNPDTKLLKVYNSNKEYLNYHRDKIFLK